MYFYQLGLRLGVDRLAEIANGFSRPADRHRPRPGAAPGWFRRSEWKQRRFGEVWMKGETVSTAIGQGFNLATPLQIAVAYAAIANGGKIVRPRLVLRTEDRRTASVTPGPAPEVLGERSPWIRPTSNAWWTHSRRSSGRTVEPRAAPGSRTCAWRARRAPRRSCA